MTDSRAKDTMGVGHKSSRIALLVLGLFAIAALGMVVVY